MLSEHDNIQDALVEDSVLSSFHLFLSLMTPVEFAKLLRSRVEHLLQIWPPASTPDDHTSHDIVHAHSNRPLPLSLSSIQSFTSFFRTQETPAFAESGAKSTPPSSHNLQQHLFALETLLSCVTPKELQNLIHSRLKEGGKERTAAIRGLLDIMRCAAIDETPETPSCHENPNSNVNLCSNAIVEDYATPSANTCIVNISPGTAQIPRVMSPGTRDQSADAGDSNPLESRDAHKSHRLSRTTKELVSESTSKQSAPLFSPTVSTTSRISSSTVTSPVERPHMRGVLESQINSRTKYDSSFAKDKDSAPTTHSPDFKTDVFPYSKLTRLSRRSQTSPTSIPDPSSSQPWFNLRLPERPHRKSERLSKQSQSSSKSPEMREGLALVDIKPPSLVTSTMSAVAPSVRAKRLEGASSSFAYMRADGRESPPAPVLRAVDWSNPVRSASLGSDEDDDDAMEEEEELDELADDTSEADSRIPEIVDGWNSYESKNDLPLSSIQKTPPSTSVTAISSPNVSYNCEIKEPVSDDAAGTFPLHSPQYNHPNMSVVAEPVITAEQKMDSEPNGLVLPQGQPMNVDGPRPISTAPETTPLQPSLPQQPAYTPYYSNSHPLPGHNPYSSPVHHQVSIPYPPQPLPLPPHQHTHTSNVPPPSYHPPLPHHSHGLNPYPPPATHSYDYPSLPPPPSHISPYLSQYTTSPWYGNSYFHQPPPQPSYPTSHPPMPSYPHQPANIPLPLGPPAHDQRLHLPQMPISHSQSYTPSNYPSAPSQGSTLSSFPLVHNSQVQYQSPSQGQYPPDGHGQYPPHTQPNPYHPSASFSSPGPPHPQQHVSIHPQLQKSISDLMPITTNPKPSSPVIPPPSGPRPSVPVISLAPTHRSPSPPVKPPEGPKRFFQGRRGNDTGVVNFSFGTKNFDDPNVRYTDDVGIKETAIIRRRCHNCNSVEAPSWRKSKLHVGKILCNKCGIYESTHMMARPLKTRPRRLLLNGERDYLFEMFKNQPSPVTPPSGSPTSSLPAFTSSSVKRRRRMKKSPHSDNDDDDEDDDYNIDE